MSQHNGVTATKSHVGPDALAVGFAVEGDGAAILATNSSLAGDSPIVGGGACADACVAVASSAIVADAVLTEVDFGGLNVRLIDAQTRCYCTGDALEVAVDTLDSCNISD